MLACRGVKLCLWRGGSELQREGEVWVRGGSGRKRKQEYITYRGQTLVPKKAESKQEMGKGMRQTT